MLQTINVMNDREALEVLFLQMLGYRMERQALGLGEGEPFPDSISALQSSGETFIGVRKEEQLVAAVSYLRSGPEAAIRRLVVHPDYIRRGLGTRLLKEIELREPGLERVSVTAGSGNAPAMALYESCGYRVFERHRHSSGIMLATLEKFLMG